MMSWDSRIPIILGPFEARTHHGMMALLDDRVILIRLGLLSSIKFGIALQTPFYAGYTGKLRGASLGQLLIGRSSIEFPKNDGLRMEVVRGRHKKHAVMIQHAQRSMRWYLMERNDVDEYEAIIGRYMRGPRVAPDGRAMLSS